MTAVLLGLWVAFLEVFDVNAYVGKTPAQVWEWVTDPAEGTERRAELWDATRETLVEAGLGFAVGLGAAVVVAIAFTLSRPLERAVRIRTVPHSPPRAPPRRRPPRWAGTFASVAK